MHLKHLYTHYALLLGENSMRFTHPLTFFINIPFSSFGDIITRFSILKKNEVCKGFCFLTIYINHLIMIEKADQKGAKNLRQSH